MTDTGQTNARTANFPIMRAAFARLAAALLILSGIWLVFWTSLRPLITLEPVDFAHEQKDMVTDVRAMFEENRYMASLPQDAFIAEKTKGRLLVADNRRDLASDILAASGGDKNAAWLWRASPDYRNITLLPRPLFFAPADPTLAGIDLAAAREQSHYLKIGGDYFELRWHDFSNDSFTLGSGFSGMTPPPELFHPLREAGFLLMLAGILCQFFMGFPHFEKGVARHARWRVVLADLAAAMMLYGFYVLPILIAGGSVQAIMVAWPIALVLWGLAGLGALLVWYAAVIATFSVAASAEGLVLTGIAGNRTIAWRDIAAVSPAVKKPPKWLIILMWLAALSGRSNGGQALLLSSSASHGTAFRLKDGRTVFVWATDQMGGSSLLFWNDVLAAVKKAGVAENREPIERRGMGLDLVVDARGRSMGDGKAVFVSMASLAATLALLSLLGSGMDSIGETSFPLPEKPEPAGMAEMGIPAAGTALPASALAASKSFTFTDDAEVERANAASPLDDGGWLLVGETTAGTDDMDLLAMRLAPDGSETWRRGIDRGRTDYGSISAEGRDGRLLVIGEGKAVDYLASDMSITLLGADGAEISHSFIGDEETYDYANAAIALQDGGYAVAGELDGRLAVIRLDSDAGIVWQKTFSGLGTARAFDIRELPEGGFIVAGETESSGPGFIDALVLRLDGNGEPVWQKTYGSPRHDSARKIAVAADRGSILLAGETAAEGRKDTDILAARMNMDGETGRQATFGGETNERALAIMETGDGALRILASAESRGGEGQGYLLIADVAESGEAVLRHWPPETGDFILTGASFTKDGGILALSRRTSVIDMDILKAGF